MTSVSYDCTASHETSSSTSIGDRSHPNLYAISLLVLPREAPGLEDAGGGDLPELGHPGFDVLTLLIIILHPHNLPAQPGDGEAIIILYIALGLRGQCICNAMPAAL